jgi:hypothetical protein
LCLLLTVAPASYAGGWHVSAGVEQGTLGGWVRVREFAIRGTRLYLRDDLNASTMQTLRLGAWKSLSPDSQLHVGFATHRFTGQAVFGTPVYFNGTTVPAGGRLETATSWQDFLGFDASWWRRLVTLDDGGTLWGSLGATYTMLNFRMHGPIAADSVGHELKEDFYVQELPIPTVGLHLRMPLAGAWSLAADATAGRLPWVNSLRTEGGEVRLAQTNVEARVGVSDAFAPRWTLDVYAFHRALVQSERSREDGNFVRLHSTGVGVRLAHGL